MVGFALCVVKKHLLQFTHERSPEKVWGSNLCQLWVSLRSVREWKIRDSQVSVICSANWKGKCACDRSLNYLKGTWLIIKSWHHVTVADFCLVKVKPSFILEPPIECLDNKLEWPRGEVHKDTLYWSCGEVFQAWPPVILSYPVYCFSSCHSVKIEIEDLNLFWLESTWTRSPLIIHC